jgi:hypothetical protein
MIIREMSPSCKDGRPLGFRPDWEDRDMTGPLGVEDGRSALPSGCEDAPEARLLRPANRSIRPDRDMPYATTALAMSGADQSRITVSNKNHLS